MSGHFAGDRHALFVGMVLGLALRAGIPLEPERDDEGNYTDRLMLTLRPDFTIAFVVPPPPEDWTPDDWLKEPEE